MRGFFLVFKASFWGFGVFWGFFGFFGVVFWVLGVFGVSPQKAGGRDGERPRQDGGGMSGVFWGDRERGALPGAGQEEFGKIRAQR